jgi:predicted dehydrogenase
VAEEFHTRVFGDLEELRGRVKAASVAVPTEAHSEVGCRLLDMGIDVLVEKPMATDLIQADALLIAANRNQRILQVGHVERFNPAVIAVEPIVNRPLFFEVHRLGVFTARSLDVDVIYDLMIHDLDILLALVKEPVTEVKAVGIPVLTDKVDIAHARLEFTGGAVANVTASRVSTERVRKMRFFQQHEYISLDYARRDALRVGVKKAGPQPEFGFEKLPAPAIEPLHAELDAFVESVRSRQEPRVNGAAGRAALELAGRVMESIQEHAERVQLATRTANKPA